MSKLSHYKYRMSKLFHYKCRACHTEQNSNRLQEHCKICGGTLIKVDK